MPFRSDFSKKDYDRKVNFEYVIKDVRRAYMLRHYPHNNNVLFSEVNEVSSDLFAACVMQRLNKYRTSNYGYCTVISLENYLDENKHIIFDEEFFSIFTPSVVGLTYEDISVVTFKRYTCIMYNRRFYDIETPEGRDNMIEMPYVQRTIRNQIAYNEYLKQISRTNSDVIKLGEPFAIEEGLKQEADIFYPPLEYIRNYVMKLPSKEEYYKEDVKKDGELDT